MKFLIALELLDPEQAKRTGSVLTLVNATNGFVELLLTIPASGKTKPVQQSLGFLHLSELRATLNGAEALTGGMR